jgi:hypothetical protein
VSVGAVIWWTIGAAWLLVFVMILLQLIRVARELVRAMNRVADYGVLPVVASIERSETDIARIEGAVAAIDPLVARARAAVSVIKRGPFPPEVVGAYARLRAQRAAFRAAAPRR